MVKKKSTKVNKSSLRGKYTGYADPYRQSYTTNELLALRRKYAKAVNQRLVRQERAGFSIGDSPALELLAKMGRRRFSEVAGAPAHLRNADGNVDRNALKREIATLTGFLTSIRTTTEGVKSIVKSTSKTLQNRYGVNLSGAEMDFLLRNFNDFKAAVKMNSDALLQALGEVSGDITNRQQIKSIIKELKDKKTTQEQAAAIYEGVYKRRKKNRPEMGKTISAIEKALLR